MGCIGTRGCEIPSGRYLNASVRMGQVCWKCVAPSFRDERFVLLLYLFVLFFRFQFVAPTCSLGTNTAHTYAPHCKGSCFFVLVLFASFYTWLQIVEDVGVEGNENGA